MFPLVHPGIAYLAYAVVRRLTGTDPPADLPTTALVVGALLPDLVDQPLYYAVDLPSTRTVGHSLLVAVPVCVAVVAAVRRSVLPNAVGIGFGVGYLSHSVADALWPLLLGLYEELGYLLWPVIHSPPYVGQKPLGTVGDVTVTTLWIELPILAVALVLWWRHGRPGLRHRLR